MSFIAPRLIFENHNCKPCNTVGYLEIVICRQPTEVIEYNQPTKVIEYNQQTESIEYTDIIPKSIITDYLCLLFVRFDNDGINVRYYISNRIWYFRLIVEICSDDNELYDYMLCIIKEDSGNHQLIIPIVNRSRSYYDTYMNIGYSLHSMPYQFGGISYGHNYEMECKHDS